MAVVIVSCRKLSYTRFLRYTKGLPKLKNYMAEVPEFIISFGIPNGEGGRAVLTGFTYKAFKNCITFLRTQQ
jgi:hypothetical protein